MSFLLRSVYRFGGRLYNGLSQTASTTRLLLQEPQPLTGLSSSWPTISIRNSGFFTHLTQDQLWRSATSVSNAGRKRGRARGRKMIKNLNRGQQIGVGETSMVWPGLNAPLFRGREVVGIQELPPDPTRKEKLYKLRDSVEKFRQARVTMMERGWSGNKMPGRSIGPPDPIGDEKFDKFDCRVLEMKQVANMTGKYGRVRRFSILVVTGNKNGLVGVALAKDVDAKTALRKAKNLSIRKLRYVERFEGRTVFHDFHHQIDSTCLFVERRPEGGGVRSHRAIKTMCDVIGIRDLYAKVEGRVNLQKVVKCFIAGLEEQESHEQLSERKGLHVVEFKKENQLFPNVLASPKKIPVRQTPAEIGQFETVQFPELYSEDQVRLVKPKKEPFYAQYPSYKKYLKLMERKRGQTESRIYHWMQRDFKGKDTPLYQHLGQPDSGHLPFNKPGSRKEKEKKQ